jgi:hypothetical protein
MISEVPVTESITIWNVVKVFGPALLTVLLNIGFFLIIKKRVDQRIEKLKISYSGIFKERIDIYRELLSRIYDLKLRVQQFHYNGTNENIIGKIEIGRGALTLSNLQDEFSGLISFQLKNQPFISDHINLSVKTMIKELQQCLDSFCMAKAAEGREGVEFLKDSIKSMNKFKTNTPFKAIEDSIIEEMKTDLQIEKIKG